MSNNDNLRHNFRQNDVYQQQLATILDKKDARQRHLMTIFKQMTSYNNKYRLLLDVYRQLSTTILDEITSNIDQ